MCRQKGSLEASEVLGLGPWLGCVWRVFFLLVADPQGALRVMIAATAYGRVIISEAYVNIHK